MVSFRLMLKSEDGLETNTDWATEMSFLRDGRNLFKHIRHILNFESAESVSMPFKINLAEKFAQIPEIEKPHIVADVNDFQVKLSKLKGPFVWHHHEKEDELFLIVKANCG